MMHLQFVKLLNNASLSRRRLLAYSLLFIATIGSNADANEWTQHQGNAQHTGVAVGNTISIPLTLRWMSELSDGPMRPVSVASGRVLVTNFESGQHTVNLGMAYCLDAIRGNILWAKEFDRIADPGQVTIGDGRAYIQVSRGWDSAAFIASYDLTTGTKHWKATYPAQIQNLMAPTLFKNTLLFEGGTYGGLFSINATTAQENWFVRKAQYTEWAPAVIHDTVFTFLRWTFTAYDLKTGDTLYQRFLENEFGTTRREADSSFPLSVLETQDNSSTLGAAYDQYTAVVLDTVTGLAYATNVSGVLAIDYSSGDLIWRRDGFYRNRIPDVLANVITPPVYDGVLYIYDSSRLIACDASTGEDLWKFQGDSALFFNPVISDDYIFVASINNVYAISLSTHVAKWSHPVGGYLSPANNGLYVSTLNGKVLFFGDVATSIDDDEPAPLPTYYELHQNYPNPFNASTKIDYSVPRLSHVKISIYNSLGQHIETLVNGEKSTGNYTVTWDGKNKLGKTVSSGVYFYKLTAGEFVRSKKMLLLK